MKVAIVKYNAGNVQSVIFALHRLGVQAVVTDSPEELLNADKVIFPGVGEASTAMHYLREHKLDQVLIQLKQPFLGICLGMQLMCSFSEENNTPCLELFPLKVKKFPPTDKVPHMGWNTVYRQSSPLFLGIHENEYFYFVHSYYAETGIETIGTTDYILSYSAALQKDNFFGVQFHPEKSGESGAKILHNFLKL